jgi:hypothetical protein
MLQWRRQLSRQSMSPAEALADAELEIAELYTVLDGLGVDPDGLDEVECSTCEASRLKAERLQDELRPLKAMISALRVALGDIK